MKIYQSSSPVQQSSPPIVYTRYCAICWLQQTNKPSVVLVCSILSFKLSLEVKKCWLAYLLAMGSHFALHCYHAMTKRVDNAINSLLCKFNVNVNYIPTCLRRQLLNSAATTRTPCYQTLFRVRFRGLGHETTNYHGDLCGREWLIEI